MCCSVSNFNILNKHVGPLSHHTVIIIRLGTLLPGQPGWEYTRRKSILIKILTLFEYNCVCCSPDSKVKRMIISPNCQSLQKCISDLYMFPWICCSFTQLCPIICNPMDCSTPGLPILHYAPKFPQIHVHWANGAIQPSHPLSSPSPPAFNLSQHQGLFQWVKVLAIRWPKY